MRILFLALALLLPACERRDRDRGDQPQQPQPPPAPTIDAAPPPAPDPRAAARRKTVEFMEELASAVDDNKSDCAAMTLAVGAVVDRNRSLVDVVRRVRARGDSADRQKEPGQVEFHDQLQDEYGPRIAEVKRKLAAVDTCIPQSPQLAEMLGDIGKQPPAPPP